MEETQFHRDQEYFEQAREVGGRVRAARLAAGMSRAQLAVVVECPVSAIQRIERGEQLPMPARARRIMQALGMEEGYFYQGR